jgi:hypothetical protein
MRGDTGREPRLGRCTTQLTGPAVTAPGPIAGSRAGGTAVTDKEPLRALPRDVPDYHERQAAHLRALAATATTPAVKARLLREAEEHERIAADC